MIQFTYSRCEVPAYAGGPLSMDVQRRQTAEIWHIPQAPLRLDKPDAGQWTWYRKGDSVAIPLAPYLTGVEPGGALVFAMQLAMAAMHQGLAKAADLPDLSRTTLKRVHVSLGDPVNHVTDQGQPRLQAQIGVALVF